MCDIGCTGGSFTNLPTACVRENSRGLFISVTDKERFFFLCPNTPRKFSRNICFQRKRAVV